MLKPPLKTLKDEKTVKNIYDTQQQRFYYVIQTNETEPETESPRQTHRDTDTETETQKDTET